MSKSSNRTLVRITPENELAVKTIVALWPVAPSLTRVVNTALAEWINAQPKSNTKKTK